MGLPDENVDYGLFRWENYNIFSKTSNQKKMQDMAYTDEDGFRRIDIDGLDKPAYMAALGSYYLKDENGEENPNGVVFRVYLSNGHSFYLVAGDMKDDKNTNSGSHQYTNYFDDEDKTDIIEFIIDKANMDKSLWSNNFKGKPPYFQGEIIRIERLDMIVLG